MSAPQRQPGKFIHSVVRIAVLCSQSFVQKRALSRQYVQDEIFQAVSTKRQRQCPCVEVARERARKIASKNRSSTTTGIGGSFQLANSAPPLGVTGSASAPTARMGMGHGPRAGASNTRLRRSGQEVPVRQFPRRGSRPWRECNARARATLAPSKPDGQASPEKNCCDKMTVTWTVYQLSH